MLWGSCSDQQARQSLRQALASLRKELRWSHFFVADADVVRLQPATWSVDARELEELSRSGGAENLQKAGRLFGGEFLTGLSLDEEGFDEWLRAQRQRVQVAAARLCETYAARPDLVIDGDEAIGVAERLMALDPLREDWQRFALTLYARYRGKNETLVQADAFAALLQRELGVKPEAETRALIEAIRGGAVAAISPARARPALAADVRTAPAIEAASEEPTAQPIAARLPVRSPRWPVHMAAAAAVAILALAGAIYGFTSGRSVLTPIGGSRTEAPGQPNPWQSPPLPSRRGTALADVKKNVVPIVVLPFKTYGEAAGPILQLAEMMTDDLINMLSRVSMFRVIARQTSRSYKDQPVDVAAIGAELGVRYVLDGSMRMQGNTLRVTVDLVDAATRATVWSGRIERDDGDRYAAQDEIVGRLARELQFEIYPIESERRSRDPDADALTFRGWAAMNAAYTRTGPDAFKQAETLFLQALEREPRHISARVGLGAYHANMGAQALDGESKAHLDRAREILLGIIERAPRHGGAHFYLGLVHGASGKPDEALAAFTWAIEENPSHTGAHAHIGNVLTRMGRAAEGLEHLRYAIRLSPRDPNLAYWLDFVGRAELALSRHQAAIDSFRRSTALNPGSPRGWAGLAAAHALAGNMSEARVHADKLRAFAPQLGADALVERLGFCYLPGFRVGRGVAVTPDGFLWLSPRARSRPAAEVRRPDGIVALVVLPFTVAGEGGEPSALAAAVMTDDLTNVLARISAFRVISRQTALAYRDKRIDAAAIGAELGVRYLLEGSVSLSGDRLHANLALTDTGTRQRVWSGRFERAGADRLAVQDEIVKSLGRELQLEVTQLESQPGSNDPDVHALIFKGWAALLDAGSRGLDALEQAEAHFNEALSRDPENPRALAGLGAYHVNMAVQLFAADPAPHLAKAEALLRQAIDRAPSLPAAHHFMGMVHIARGRGDLAAPWFERTIALSPSHAQSYAQLGRTAIRAGRPQEGLEHVLYAMRLSPRDPSIAYWLGFAGAAELELTHYDKAIAYLDRAVALQPRQPRNLLVLAAAHALAGNVDGARLRLAQVQKALPHLSNEKLIARFFGGKESGPAWPRLKEGLRLAIAADPWRSPTAGVETAALAARANESVIPVVVLPFGGGEGDTVMTAMADGITDDLINNLSRIYRFRVISRNTSKAYRGKPTDPAALGAELGVRYVVEGSIRPRGERLRVNVELIDTATRLAVWTDQFEQEQTNRHVVTDEIVRRIGRALQVETQALEVKRIPEPEAVHQLVDKGWVVMFGPGDAAKRLKQAEALFTEALAKDPRSRAARMGLAAYHVIVVAELFEADLLPHIEKAFSLLEGLVAENPGSAGAHYWLARTYRHRGDFEAALRAFARSLELNPSQTEAHAQVGITLLFMRRPVEALEHVRYAMRLSPKDKNLIWWWRFAAEAELELGNTAEAVRNVERSIELLPNQQRAWGVLAAAQALAGNAEAARKAVAKVKALGRGYSDEQLLARIGRLARLGPNRLHEGLQKALEIAARSPWDSPPLPSRPATPGDRQAVTAIAVLPFTTYGDTAGSLQQVADMITDDLINALSRLPPVRVISRQTMRSYRGQPIDVATIGADLQVRYVLEGSMRMHGDKLRINVELVDPPTRLPVWSTRIERENADRATVQDEIVGRLARELKLEVYHAESERVTKDPDLAQLSYVGWVALLDNGTAGLDALKRAEATFTEILARDPQHLSARRGLGAFHVIVGSLSLLPDRGGHLTRGEALLRQAIREQPNVAGPHFYHSIAQRMRGRLDDALESLARCLEIAPSDASCEAHIGHTLVQLKRPAEGLEHIRYALRLGPRDPSRSHWLRFAGEAEIELMRHQDAVNSLRQSLALNPRQPNALRSLAAALALAGKPEEGRTVVSELKAVAPHISEGDLLKRADRIESWQPQLARGLRLAFDETLPPAVAAPKQLTGGAPMPAEVAPTKVR